MSDEWWENLDGLGGPRSAPGPEDVIKITGYNSLTPEQREALNDSLSRHGLDLTPDDGEQYLEPPYWAVHVSDKSLAVGAMVLAVAAFIWGWRRG